MENKITDTIQYIGVDDKEIDLFEGQYIVPNGISYNSYLIKDEKNVLMDTVDERASEEWMKNLENALQGEVVDYLVISHLEFDHSSQIQLLCEKYPQMKLIGNAKTFSLLPQFFEIENLESRKIIVGEGEELRLGKHILKFIMAPMVHWPEVMMTYEKTEKILFSADAFGKFGTLDTKEDWDCEARRYYFNIVGKYGVQVQAVLKKAAELEIQTICPLHGPILKENLNHFIQKYDIWSRYQPEEEGIFIAYTSMHGNTEIAAKEMKKMLEAKGAKKVVITDLAREDMAEAIEDAFRYDTMLLAAPSYNGGVFPVMEQFLRALKSKNYQKRNIGMIENGTWAPSAAKTMMELLGEMKEIKVIEPVVTIKTTLKDENRERMERLAENLVRS